MFNPDEKANQHYVPQFWQRRFSGSDGFIYKLNHRQVRRAGSKHLMSDDWLYTTFDVRGMPSNRFEDALSIFEGQAAEAMSRLDFGGKYTGSIEDQLLLRWFVALSACRHPDTMGLGYRRSKELAYALADARTMSLADFQLALARFGMSSDQAAAAFQILRSHSEDELLRQAEDVEYRPPNDPILPAQLALEPETIERVFFLLGKHMVTILDAPLGHSFILGDTPLPPDLGKGFTVPLSSTMALLWGVGGTEMLPDWTRRQATVREVEDSNQTQLNNSAEVVIGSSKAVLQPYVPSPL